MTFTEKTMQTNNDTNAEKTPQGSEWRDGGLQARPGFLIRRLHQLHTALFTEECGAENITPIMYSILSALAQSGPVDQTTLSRAIAVDKTNMADVLERLRKRGLIRRRVSSKDKRVRLATLTQEGQELLDRVDDRAERAHQRTIEDLSADQQILFIDLMTHILRAKDQMAGPAGTED